jgi:phage terminase large subunit-like protein
MALENYKPSRFMLPASHYDKAKADRAVTFIEALKHTKGKWRGKNFLLLPWQEQIIRDLFGIVKADGFRQFNTAYIEICKKAGKSELAAAVALYLLIADKEQSAEVYGAAADRQQASIVFDVASQMVQQSPILHEVVKIMRSVKRLVYPKTNSFYQVLSAESYTKHGLNISGCVMDELHAQPDRKLYDVMMFGAGNARSQVLNFIITTAGTDMNGICYEVHKKADEILRDKYPTRPFTPLFTPRRRRRTGLTKRCGAQPTRRSA